MRALYTDGWQVPPHYDPQTKRLVELVREGAIGELRLVRSAFSYSLYDTENIRLRTDVDVVAYDTTDDRAENYDSLDLAVARAEDIKGVLLRDGWLEPS